ncbi:MAG: tyrosine-type recombinase/integrase [Pseudonocardiaceae bacterium]
MSFVSRTPEGHYRANWREPSGRQKAKTFRTKTEAKRFLAGIDGSLSRGLYVDPHAGRLLFATHAREWLDSRNDELTTRARDASIMHTHVLPQWGTWPLSKIDHLSVQKWITALGTGRAPATVAEAHRLTSAVLRSAVRNRLIAFNPCEGIRLPRRRRGDTAEQVISREELRSKLLPTAPERYRAIIATAAATGLRWGEAAGLRLDALDLKRARLSVIRTVIEVGGHTSFKPYPKSSAGRRTVPLPDWLMPIIRKHLDQYPSPANAPIYANAVGKPLRRTLFRSRVWRPLLVKAGMLGALTVINDNTVRASWTDNTGATLAKEFTTEREAVLHIAKSCAGGLRFHDLRHSYATWLVDDGVPVNMVQRVMGHERSSTTLDLYTRRTNDHDRILRALDDDADLC